MDSENLQEKNVTSLITDDKASLPSLMNDDNTENPLPINELEESIHPNIESNEAFTSAPRNLTCPEPLPRLIADEDSDMFSGSKFHPVIHQSRRDMYGGNLRKGIPKGFQHILYDISNAIIKESNYGKTDPETKMVFNGKGDIYEVLAKFLEGRLLQRQDANGKKISYDPNDDDELPSKPLMSATVYMRTLDNSGFNDSNQL